MNDWKAEPIGKYRTRDRGIVIVGCDKDKTNNVGMLSAASLYIRLLAKFVQSGSQRDTRRRKTNSHVFILADSFTKLVLRLSASGDYEKLQLLSVLGHFVLSRSHAEKQSQQTK